MKSILYVGATLMIGASIYGFVDYQQTSRHKEFTNMYKESEVNDPETITDQKTAVAESKEPAVKGKTAVVKKQVINNDKTIAGVKPIAEEEKINVRESKEIENTAVTVAPPKDNISDKVVTHKKRKLSTKLFSRGALDERYIKEEVKKPEVPTTKTESGKIENKEQ